MQCPQCPQCSVLEANKPCEELQWDLGSRARTPGPDHRRTRLTAARHPNARGHLHSNVLRSEPEETATHRVHRVHRSSVEIENANCPKPSRTSSESQLSSRLRWGFHKVLAYGTYHWPKRSSWRNSERLKPEPSQEYNMAETAPTWKHAGHSQSRRMSRGPCLLGLENLETSLMNSHDWLHLTNYSWNYSWNC